MITFILDSQNLIQILENLTFPCNSNLYSCDFDSLFTKINLQHALTLITEFVSKNLFCDELKTTAFYKLLKFLFENNYFIFDNLIYKQINGVAMGSKCAPSIANLYIYILEKNFLTIHKPLFYKRFVDDIFIITTPDFDINILKNHFDYLVLNIVNEKVVNFLDLLISLDRTIGKLVFSLYIKPTNTFSYLLTSSNHPSFIFKNIPKGVLFRVRRICTYLFDFFYFARLFRTQFIKRGYNEILVDKTIRMISNLDRNKIIPYNSKNKSKNLNFANNLFFKLPFNFNCLNIEKNFSSSYMPNIIFKNSKLKLINSINPSVSSIFIHDFKLKKPTHFYYKKCSKISCKHCCFADTNFYIKLTNSFYLPIMRNSCCDSINVLYIIYCKTCLFYYIGQTKNLKKRFACHKRNIYLNIQENETLKLINHFNLLNHSLKNNFSFFVFKTDICNLSDRLNQENQLMQLFSKLEIPILNEKIPKIDCHRKFSLLFDRS